jgi:hypothetical protein
MFTARGHGHHARTAAQGTLCAQQDGATKAAITADQQDVAEFAFMGGWSPARQTRQRTGRQATCTDGDAVKRLGGGLQIVEHQRPNHVCSITSEQTQFQADERHRQVSPHRSAEYSAGISAQPRRDIHRRNRQPAAVDRRNGARVGCSHLTRQAVAEQGIQHDTVQLRLCVPGLNRDTFGHGLGMG